MRTWYYFHFVVRIAGIPNRFLKDYRKYTVIPVCTADRSRAQVHIYNMQFDSYQDTAPDSRPQTQPQAGTPSCTSQHNIVINDCMYQHGLLTV